MFDIGFWEIILISVIGLIVLGPERLPIAIRSVMRFINTAKGMANSVKSEISHELKLHEMNEGVNKAKKQKVSDLMPELKQSIEEIKQAVSPSKQSDATPDTLAKKPNQQDKTDECQ